VEGVMMKGERMIGREQDYQTDDYWSSNTKVLYFFQHVKRKWQRKGVMVLGLLP